VAITASWFKPVLKLYTLRAVFNEVLCAANSTELFICIGDVFRVAFEGNACKTLDVFRGRTWAHCLVFV
jgi:hypothetical protein